MIDFSSDSKMDELSGDGEKPTTPNSDSGTPILDNVFSFSR